MKNDNDYSFRRSELHQQIQAEMEGAYREFAASVSRRSAKKSDTCSAFLCRNLGHGHCAYCGGSRCEKHWLSKQLAIGERRQTIYFCDNTCLNRFYDTGSRAGWMDDHFIRILD